MYFDMIPSELIPIILDNLKFQDIFNFYTAYPKLAGKKLNNYLPFYNKKYLYNGIINFQVLCDACLKKIKNKIYYFINLDLLTCYDISSLDSSDDPSSLFSIESNSSSELEGDDLINNKYLGVNKKNQPTDNLLDEDNRYLEYYQKEQINCKKEMNILKPLIIRNFIELTFKNKIKINRAFCCYHHKANYHIPFDIWEEIFVDLIETLNDGLAYSCEICGGINHFPYSKN